MRYIESFFTTSDNSSSFAQSSLYLHFLHSNRYSCVSGHLLPRHISTKYLVTATIPGIVCLSSLFIFFHLTTAFSILIIFVYSFHSAKSILIGFLIDFIHNIVFIDIVNSSNHQRRYEYMSDFFNESFFRVWITSFCFRARLNKFSAFLLQNISLTLTTKFCNTLIHKTAKSFIVNHCWPILSVV